MNSRSNGNDFQPGDMSVEFSKPVLSFGRRVMYYILVMLVMVAVSLPALMYALLQR